MYSVYSRYNSAYLHNSPSWIREQSPSTDIVRRWEPAISQTENSHSRYRSAYQYACEPVLSEIPRVTRLWESTISDSNDYSYSSKDKAFYSTVPYNRPAFGCFPTIGQFDTTRLEQTDVLNVIHSGRSESNLFGTVSLAQTIQPIISKMGTIHDVRTGKNIGTCTLIAENLVLMARHAIEAKNIHNLKVTFGSVKLGGSSYCAGETRLDYVIEEDSECDYAIIKLQAPLGRELGYVNLNTEDEILSEPALLHYPLGKALKVSVHSFDQTNYQANYLKTFHDSDYFSSGGAYFDQLGRFTAMHLGAELEGDKVNVCRYAITLQEIVRRNRSSILAKFATGRLSQNQSYISPAPKHYLYTSLQNFLIDEEAYQSQKILTKLLKKHIGTDRKISMTRTGVVAFSKKNIQYMKATYPVEFAKLQKECLKVAGLHKITSKYSIPRIIESDHTIPHYVWKSTKNPKMKKLVTGTGTQPGKDEMPAITIPYSIHRALLTTGSSHNVKKFSNSLVSLCDRNRVDEALIKCFEEYVRHGIDLTSYKEAIKGSLREHVTLNLISTQQEKKIIRRFFGR